MSFVFVAYFIPRFTPTEDPQKQDLNVLPRLEGNEDFRNCVIGEDNDCVKNLISQVIPSGYGYDASISNDVDYEKTGLPAGNVYIESAFISSNMTIYSTKIVKLYYWRK